MISRSISHEEYLRRKRNKRLWKFWGTVFVVVFLVGIGSYISYRKEVRISKVELTGGILVTQPELESRALEYMQGSYFWLFPKNNILWYPRGGLKIYLKETFKRIENININLKDLQTLYVKIEERKPFALWCNQSVVSTTTPATEGQSGDNKTEDCYFMDQNSTIFARAPVFSGDAYFKYYGLISPENQSPIGMEYMSNNLKFGEISDFVQKAKELSIRPLYLKIKSDDDFSLVLSGGGEVYFNLKESLFIAGQNLGALLKTSPFASSTGDLPVEYIDLRYGNKLFYKLK